MSIKDEIDQRLADLKGCGKDKYGVMIEAKAAQLALRDITLSAKIARSALETGAGNDDINVAPTMEDILAVHQLYQAYLNSAYVSLVDSGDIPHQPVPTTPSPAMTKDDLVS